MEELRRLVFSLSLRATCFCYSMLNNLCLRAIRISKVETYLLYMVVYWEIYNLPHIWVCNILIESYPVVPIQLGSLLLSSRLYTLMFAELWYHLTSTWRPAPMPERRILLTGRPNSGKLTFLKGMLCIHNSSIIISCWGHRCSSPHWLCPTMQWFRISRRTLPHL